MFIVEWNNAKSKCFCLRVTLLQQCLVVHLFQSETYTNVGDRLQTELFSGDKENGSYMFNHVSILDVKTYQPL